MATINENNGLSHYNRARRMNLESAVDSHRFEFINAVKLLNFQSVSMS